MFTVQQSKKPLGLLDLCARHIPKDLILHQHCCKQLSPSASLHAWSNSHQPSPVLSIVLKYSIKYFRKATHTCVCMRACALVWYIYCVLCIYIEYVSETTKPQLRFYCPDFGYVAISVKKGAQFFLIEGQVIGNLYVWGLHKFYVVRNGEEQPLSPLSHWNKRMFVGLWLSLDHSFRLSVWLSRS